MKYRIDPFKLFQKYSTYDSCHDFCDDRSFFCSELIASVYKVIGILPKEISASQYWPGSFSSENNLNLLNSASLGEEYIIDFSENEKKNKIKITKK